MMRSCVSTTHLASYIGTVSAVLFALVRTTDHSVVKTYKDTMHRFDQLAGYWQLRCRRVLDIHRRLKIEL
jgi:hypothetical protein